jgi:hypothetical protein
MLRLCILSVFSVVSLFAAAFAQAGEAGRIVFVTGAAYSGNTALQQGQAIAEGAELSTGANAYVYLKTVDNGFLILRPSTRARVVAYHIDAANPANTRIKFELISGVARVISGQAVKAARQNFRFNTPVAAIGVRGTDFTVFTTNETSRVAVFSGGIVVSGFAGACGPEGTGPCEGGGSHELTASQVGQLLQIKRGQAAPQLLNGQVLPPDAAPARSDEPKAAGSAPANSAQNNLSLDPEKNASLVVRNITPVPQPVATPTPEPIVTPPIVTPPVVVPAAAQGQIVWGRWQAVLDKAAQVDLTKERDQGGKHWQGGYYAVVRTKGADLQLPQQGKVSFTLQGSEAVIREDASQKLTLASIDNARLEVDFGKRSFSTSFDLLVQNDRFNLQSRGQIKKEGSLESDHEMALININSINITANGSLGPNGNNAAYAFSGRLDSNRQASGVTYWGK